MLGYNDDELDNTINVIDEKDARDFIKFIVKFFRQHKDILTSFEFPENSK